LRRDDRAAPDSGSPATRHRRKWAREDYVSATGDDRVGDAQLGRPSATRSSTDRFTTTRRASSAAFSEGTVDQSAPVDLHSRPPALSSAPENVAERLRIEASP
jgi:hypothetical protein